MRLLQKGSGYETISHHVQYPWTHSPHSYSVELLTNVLPCLTHSLRTKHPHLHGKVGLPPFGKLDPLVRREKAHKHQQTSRMITPLPLSLSRPPLSPWKAHMWNIRFTSLTLGSTVHSNRGRECTRTATSRRYGSCTGCRGQTQDHLMDLQKNVTAFNVYSKLYIVHTAYCLLSIAILHIVYCILYVD